MASVAAVVVGDCACAGWRYLLAVGLLVGAPTHGSAGPGALARLQLVACAPLAGSTGSGAVLSQRLYPSPALACCVGKNTCSVRDCGNYARSAGMGARYGPCARPLAALAPGNALPPSNAFSPGDAFPPDNAFPPGDAFPPDGRHSVIPAKAGIHSWRAGPRCGSYSACMPRS